MNGDNILVFIFVALPIGGLGITFLLILIINRLSTIVCPYCFRRIPKDALEYGVPCPECGVELAATDTGNTVADANPPCRICNASDDCVTLWDGQSYCTTCVAKRSSRLLEAAGTNQLIEGMPYSVGIILWRILLFLFAIIVGFAALLAILPAIGGNWEMALQIFAIVLLLGTPVILLYAGVIAVAMPYVRLKVIAWNRQLIVRVGSELHIVPLTECKWYIGKESQMTMLKVAFLLRGQALIIEFPRKTNKVLGRVAVGYTADTLELWQSFLELAGVPLSASNQSWWFRRKRDRWGAFAG